jgi:gluconate 5-dehydrogenase
MKTVQELFDLTGRVALVTGAGSGLGALFSEALAEAGAAVVCTGLRLQSVEETAEQIRHNGGEAIAIEANVTDEAAVDRMVREAVDNFGRLDILVNNAGISDVSPPEDLALDHWQRVIDVNLTGVFLGARAAARQMISAGHGGRVINIASILGAGASEPVPATAYSASKGGVVNLTRDLAVHWATKGILVNAIGPGYFLTEMTRQGFEDAAFLDGIERRTPLGRAGQLEELKGIIVFLASDASSYVTGQTIFVDGGWTAW